MKPIRATRTLRQTAGDAVELKPHPGGWFVWTEAASADAEIIADLGRWTAARRWTVPSGSGRAVHLPADVPIKLRALGRASGSVLKIMAFPSDQPGWADSEYALTQLSTTTVDWSDDPIDSLPPDADTVLVNARTGNANSRALVRIKGSDGTSFWDLREMYLGTGSLGAIAVAASVSNHAGFGNIPSCDELELSARLSVVGTGGPWNVTWFGRISGGTGVGDDVILAQSTVTDQDTGQRERVLLGVREEYASIRYNVTGTFTGGDILSLRAAFRGAGDPSSSPLGTNRAAIIKLVPGAYTHLGVSSENLTTNETVTLDAYAYRAAR